MLTPLLSSPFPRGLAPGIVFAVPLLFLVAGTIVKGARRQASAALIFLVVGVGWWLHGAIQATQPFDPTKLPAELDIAPPNSAQLAGPRLEIIGEHHVLRLEAPSELSWSLTGSERELSFEYGYIPRAYQEGKPNGAEFVVELIHGPDTRRIFQRMLLPLARLEDRPLCFAHVVLPPFPVGSRLILRLGPGEFNDNAWDWLFIGDLRFRRSSAFLPSQFPSFRPVPAEAESPLSFLYQKGGHTRFLQTDAPSTFSYVLHGGERRLSFRYGLLPGAYTNGGHSDGAVFRVTLTPPNGPTQVLFERRLQPGTLEPDRGPQRRELTLPTAPAGARLVLEIDPGPEHSNAWDWTYLNRLTLE